jgi:hypothetical protein
MRDIWPVWPVGLLAMLAACGDNNNDTIWTGFSGVLIFGLVAWLVIHFLRK